MSVAIVTVNLLSSVLFIKKRSLCTRAMYLVINLTIVDRFVGGEGKRRNEFVEWHVACFAE